MSALCLDFLLHILGTAIAVRLLVLEALIYYYVSDSCVTKYPNAIKTAFAILA